MQSNEPNYEMPTESYQTVKLHSLIPSKKKSKSAQVKAAQDYIEKYFYPSDSSVFFYDARKKKFEEVFLKSDRLAMLLPLGLTTNYMNEEEELEKFVAKSWLVNDCMTRWAWQIALNAPTVDHVNKRINLMAKPKFNDTNTAGKTFEGYPEHIKQAVLRMVDHVHIVWCSRRAEQSEHVLNFLSCSGRKKVKGCVYLQSLEQTGKTIVVDFLKAHVFGQHLVLMTSAMEAINKYTAPMEGCVLVNLNEMPCFSSGEWQCTQNNMKTLVTDNTFTCRTMYSVGRESTNTFNFIITTQNEAVNISDKNCIRYMCPDVSIEKIGDKKYFDSLVSACFNDSVGEAFFVWLRERYESKGKYWNPRDFPKTDSYKDKICERLPDVYNYIKFDLLKNGKGIKSTLPKLYARYLKYCTYKDLSKQKVVSNKECSKLLKQLYCVKVHRKKQADGSKPNYYEAGYDELYAEFDSKGWIHDLDEIDPVPISSGEPADEPASSVCSELDSGSDSKYEQVYTTSTEPNPNFAATQGFGNVFDKKETTLTFS